MYTKTCYLCGKEFTTAYHNQVLCTLPHTKVCESCGKTFYVEGINKDQDWCSDECRLKLHGRVCVLCGKTFLPKNSVQRICDNKHYNVCVVCGHEFEVNSVKDKDKKTCCKKCSAAYRKQTGEYKKYAAKARKTIQERYGNSVYNVSKKGRVCEECGQLYVPSSNHQKWCNRDHYRPCVICGKPVKVTQKEQPETCSDECRVKLIRRTCTERYGKDNYFKTDDFDKKRRQTCLTKYGVDHYSKTDEYAKKYKESSRIRYGVDNPLQSDIVKNKINKTNNERYGCDWYPSSPDFVTKVRETSLQRYGISWPTNVPSVRRRMDYTRKQTVLRKYGVPYFCLTDMCKNKATTVSRINKKFRELLTSYGIPSTLEFTVENKSYDVSLNGIGILVEINPCVSHNSYSIPFGGGKQGLSPNYHLNKTKLAESHGYRCVHVWDWDDWEKVVRLVLPTSRRVYARKCQVVELNKEATDKFLSDNHLQGTCKGQVVRLGLVCDDELVEVMTFGKPRYNKKFEWELLRLCALPGTSVVGGPSKLFSHFVKEHNPRSVLSYCDRSKFTGKVYESIGMTLADEGTSNKHWYSPRKSERMQHVTNNFLLQRGFDQIFGTSYGKGTSNEQLMLERGYLPVYDCGQMRFEWHSS